MRLGNVLVVDDDAALTGAISKWLARRAEVRAAANVAEALAVLESWTPALVLLDVSLPDGDAFDVLEALDGLAPVPLVLVITGTATPTGSFELGRRGPRGFLEKPFGKRELERAIAGLYRPPVAIGVHARHMVGQQPINDVISEVREAMLHEALARSGGSRRAAARMLAVSRQLVQYLLRQNRRTAK